MIQCRTAEVAEKGGEGGLFHHSGLWIGCFCSISQDSSITDNYKSIFEPFPLINFRSAEGGGKRSFFGGGGLKPTVCVLGGVGTRRRREKVQYALGRGGGKLWSFELIYLYHTCIFVFFLKKKTGTAGLKTQGIYISWGGRNGGGEMEEREGGRMKKNFL